MPFSSSYLDFPSMAYAQNADLQTQVNGLKATVTALQSQVQVLQAQLAAVQSNTALELDNMVYVVPGLADGVMGPHIYFKGAIIHVVSGSSITYDSSGLGNLIIGYAEPPVGLNPGDRGGSHNLVISKYHRFTQAARAGLVARELNTISNRGASVSGGTGNTASGWDSSVSGGGGNTASGDYSSVSGGYSNTAGGENTVVIGGNGVSDNNNVSIAPQPPFP